MISSFGSSPERQGEFGTGTCEKLSSTNPFSEQVHFRGTNQPKAHFWLGKANFAIGVSLKTLNDAGYKTQQALILF